jgi:hypothetical protein
MTSLGIDHRPGSSSTAVSTMTNSPCRNRIFTLKVLLILSSATTVLLVGRVHGFSIGAAAPNKKSNNAGATRSRMPDFVTLKKAEATSTSKTPMPWLPLISSALLSISLVASPLPAQATSNAAAQISLDSLPPTSISIQIQDLPVVGNLLSGTYSKVADGSIAKPSVVIKSPKDKIKAISSLATAGHIEFDINGSFLNTHLDVDVAADEAGTANVVIRSNLIPQLPFKNAASSKTTSSTIIGKNGGKESSWNIVTNMGSGESYYFNAKTGDTQFERPGKI